MRDGDRASWRARRIFRSAAGWAPLLLLVAGTWRPDRVDSLAGSDTRAAGAGSSERAAEKLAGRALGETPLMEDLRELCDRIGGRITGSPECERAIEWGVRKLGEAGLDRVWTEEFGVPTRWLPGPVEVACHSPEKFDIPAVAAPFSPSTAPTRASLVVVGSGAPKEFEALGESARGAIALVASEPMTTFEALFAEYLRNTPMLEAAQKAGVAGLLLMSTRPRGLLYRHPIRLDAQIAALPVALVSREAASRLVRLADQGPVEVGLAVSSSIGGEYRSRNVLAEIRGREKPEEIVLLGAHLDSWDLGTGAEDNGVNVALVIDVARGMKELGLIPRRTVRFALFTGEEEGLWGSAGYVNDHAAEMDRHVMAIVHDVGSGRISGFYLNGRDELRGALDAALEPVGGLGPFTHLSEAIDGTDNFDFLLAGVPNLVAEQAAEPYLPDYHASSDVYEVVNAREARANAAIAAAVVWHFAEAEERPAPRQSRAEVQALLEKNELVDVMKSFRQWEAWESGRRGGHR